VVYPGSDRGGHPPSRHRFSELLNLHIGLPIRSNLLGELMACKRTGTVVEYQDSASRRSQRVSSPRSATTWRFTPPIPYHRHEFGLQAGAARAVRGPPPAGPCRATTARSRPPGRATSTASLAGTNLCCTSPPRHRGPPGPPAVIDGDGGPLPPMPLLHLQPEIRARPQSCL
jgi:hypothetical protein